MEYLIDLFLHLDVHLAEFVAQYGVWVYAMLFAIIFIETGLIIWPFLPGDSLLFAAGALAATGALNVWIVIPLLIGAAIAGDAVNSRWAGLRDRKYSPPTITRASCTECSTAITWTRHMPSLRNTAAWRWCRGALFQSSAPSCRLLPVRLP
jgi:hypothetical protein